MKKEIQGWWWCIDSQNPPKFWPVRRVSEPLLQLKRVIDKGELCSVIGAKLG